MHRRRSKNRQDPRHKSLGGLEHTLYPLPIIRNQTPTEISVFFPLFPRRVAPYRLRGPERFAGTDKPLNPEFQTSASPDGPRCQPG